MRNHRFTLEPKFVIFFILRFSVIIFLIFGAFGSIIIIFLNRKIGPNYLEGISSLNQLQTSLPSIIFITAFVQTTILCIIVILLTLLWSHSIAGPLVRFKRYLRETAEGTPPEKPVTFRDADQLHGLGKAFSEMIITHRGNSVKALTLLVEAQRLLDDCLALKKEEKENTREFDLKFSELKEKYLRIKDIYTTRE